MKSRRQFLTASAAVLPAPALSACAGTGASKLIAASAESQTCKKPGGPSAKYFPNVVVMTHTGRKAWFYDDLIKGEIVGINFMSVRFEEHFPVTQNLAEVQELIENKMGRGTFMVSITTDPEPNTPAVLEEFAKKHDAKEGWIFVTGKPSDMQALYHKLGVHNHEGGGAHHHIWSYGNEPYTRWAASHAMAKPHQLPERLFWVKVKKDPNSKKA
ncbi:MAG: SCO family protein [Methylococcales bacterium]|nr:SCO family protein [Methylococcales bacterium]